MKVVIAGGSGLLGRAIAQALIERGDEVVVLTRGGTTAPSGTRSVTWKPPALGPWVAVVEGAAAVINLAGATIGTWPWTRARKQLLRDSRRHATRALLDSIASLPIERRPAVLVNASGTDVYEGRDAVPATEDTAPVTSFLARLCLDWETEAVRAGPLGVRVVTLRTGSVLAHDAPFLRIVALPFRLFLGGIVGSGRQWVSWIDIDDVVGLYLFALDRTDIRGALNAVAPDPRPQEAFARAIAAALGRPCWLRVPSWVVRLLLGDLATLPLGSRRVGPEKALAAGYRFRRPVLEDALAARLVARHGMDK